MSASQSFNRWVRIACIQPPFTPTGEGGNDGRVRDAVGVVVADCGGSESRADVVAAALNLAFGNGLYEPPPEVPRCRECGAPREYSAPWPVEDPAEINRRGGA
jgi:hypothetical protein